MPPDIRHHIVQRLVDFRSTSSSPAACSTTTDGPGSCSMEEGCCSKMLPFAQCSLDMPGIYNVTFYFDESNGCAKTHGGDVTSGSGRHLLPNGRLLVIYLLRIADVVYPALCALHLAQLHSKQMVYNTFAAPWPPVRQLAAARR
ncbi:unnamed protein product, partial [Mesorhabditis spiculigera]